MSKNTSDRVKPDWVGLIWVSLAVLFILLGFVFLPA